MSKHALAQPASEGPIEQSFEWLRETVGALAPAADQRARSIVWADASSTLAVSRDQRGRLEVFVVGDELVPSMPIVRDCLEYERWTTSTGVVLEANRFVLPNAPHFDGIVAFICAELL